MSLEDALNRLAAAVEAQNAAIAGTNSAAPSSPAAETKTTKAATTKATPKAKEPEAEPSAPAVTFDQLASAINTLAGKDKELTIKTLKAAGVPEKDGTPKAGLLKEDQYAAVLAAVNEAIASLDAPKAEASFV